MNADTDEETVCAYKDCTERATHVFYVTGQIGEPGKAAYCPKCSQGYAELSANHDYVSEVGWEDE